LKNRNPDPKTCCDEIHEPTAKALCLKIVREMPKNDNRYPHKISWDFESTVQGGRPWDAKWRGDPSKWKPWSDTKDPMCPNNRFGDYRPNLSSTTNTCCPTKGLPDNQQMYDHRYGVYQNVPKPTDWRVTGAQMSKPCYRGLFGETKSCKANLHIQILECKGCDCFTEHKDPKKRKRQLVSMTVQHTLLTFVEGCKPWFTLADSGVRAYISSIRKKIVDAKLKTCPNVVL